MKRARDGSGRYDYVVDPGDLYVIWDHMADAPYVANGELLAFRTRAGAVAALSLLNGRPDVDAGRDADFAAPAGEGAS